MRNKQKLLGVFLSIIFCGVFFANSYAQEEGIIPVIKFKDADIKIVLQSIAEKAVKDGKKVNILTSPDVEGFISVSLENVDWQTALDAVLRTYGYGFLWIGDTIILVDTVEKISERQAQERERQEVEVPRLKVFRLKYIDANDAKRAVTPLLSAVGRVSVLEVTGQAGWEFGTDVTKRTRSSEGKVSRTKVLVVSDISKKLDEVEQLLSEIDVMPEQILIKTKIMEVDTDYLKDIGFDWGTGDTGASEAALSFLDVSSDSGEARKQVGGHALGGLSSPSVYGSRNSSTIDNSGLKLAFKKLGGAEFEAVMHALEEDNQTNTLSSPTILTINNQEAAILVGQKYPIVNTEISTESNQVVGGSLEKYEEIGIQLNVVPQICGEEEKYINMIIHPAVTSTSSSVTIQGSGNQTIAQYPIIDTREAETQIMVGDGETVVMGGLFKEIKGKSKIGVPLLKDIPFLGRLFSRETMDIEKVDLLIFITAKIVKPGEVVSAQIFDTQEVVSEFEEETNE
jgi:type IV pilus assembly protein PilQ